MGLLQASQIKNLPHLIDLDGVLRSDGKLIEGAAQFLNHLDQDHTKACIVSNSTKFSSDKIHDFFKKQGVELKIPVMTAVDITAELLKKKYATAKVFSVDSAKESLMVLPESSSPEVVVVGDLGEGWTYDIMNEIFNLVLSGSKLLAMQVNKIGMSNGEKYLDAGSFIKAIEYGAGVEAELIGKPSKSFFEMGLNKVDVSINEPFVMIGDDLFVDVEPAIQYGGFGVLVLTGKTDEKMLGRSDVTPSIIVKELKEYVELMMTI